MLAPFHDSLWVIPLSVFVGGIIGSPHCMSMCGPIVINFANHRSRLFCYQLGRMLAYTVAGALVGGFGQALLGEDRPQWLSSLSLLLLALLLVVNGYRAISGKSMHLPVPEFLNKLSMKLWRNLRLSRLPQTLTASAAGILTVFLPCGHLYGFLLGAVATGSALKGAVFMFAFWLGSAPLLSVSGSWLQKILKPRIEGGQRWAGVLLVIAGLFSILTFGAKTENFAKHLQKNQQQDQSQKSSEHCH